jgi:hypothetical protein
VIFDNRWYFPSKWVELRGHGQLGEVLEPAQQPLSALPEGISPTDEARPVLTWPDVVSACVHGLGFPTTQDRP